MLVSKWLVVGALELYVVLLCLSVYLIFNARNLKNLISSLQSRLQQLLQDVKQARQEAQSAKDELSKVEPGKSYPEQLEEQIQQTKAYHKTLSPSHDISLDLDTSQPLPRQAAALRHAFLKAEKDALAQSEDNTPNWQVLEVKFSLLVDFYRKKFSQKAPSPPEEGEIESSTAHQPLEGQAEWEHIRSEISRSMNDLLELANTYGIDQDSIDVIYQRHSTALNQWGSSLTPEDPPPSAPQSTSTSTETDEELNNLRNLAREQQSMIEQLKRRLENAQNDEDRRQVIVDLQTQLSRQQQFIRESETCIKLMEDELNNANEDIGRLKAQLKQLRLERASEKPAQTEELEALIKENQLLRIQLHQKEQGTEKLSS
ncbi:hypothetical protein [Marinibactrum halimedae]|uniref:Uncharacterized protein n=1 Tax=Marinibactrum halimedae TaxID=1444977 RepID=A0AA37WMF8_9GAMM|nr:hypothetical protein [Marinibactrum halimedae]MCD9457864.1 hypothetical protein [Marinibactrum halimedae]GLS26315.1 hypothetical protein GCM10007877_20300 [Marinibactrum halimedae]